MVAYTISESPGAGRLGRHVEHDPRSRAYQTRAASLVSTTWVRHAKILDQGDLGSCTGNAAVGALGSDPFYPTVSLALNETEAVKLYHEATGLDSFSGAYPPDDTGSTGLAVAKACKQDGLISGYQHALGVDAALAALMVGPVITGVNWYDSFDSPDRDGLVKITADAAVRGGHEFVVRAVDVEAQTVLADNSWGTGYGNAGSFSFSFDDWARLLDEDGDVTQFVPNTEPPPTPTPVPVPVPPSDVDAHLAPILHKVLKHRWHRFTNSELDEIATWLAVKGN